VQQIFDINFTGIPKTALSELYIWFLVILAFSKFWKAQTATR